MSSTPDSPTSNTPEQDADQTALACYLSTVVAIGNCVAEIYPPVGMMYRDRLLKLPRRLGFDATPRALIQSREAVETDLIEYAATASAWIQGGLEHATAVRDHLLATQEVVGTASDLQQAFLDDLADHIETAAQVDDEAQLRRSIQRYAAGMRTYSRKANAEKLAMLADLESRRQEIETWLAGGAASDYVDAETGLLNRAAAERRLETEIRKQKPFCAVVVEWSGHDSIPESLIKTGASQIVKQLAERLAETVRPYDVIFRWSENKLMTFFEAPEAGIAARAKQIGGWLGDGTFVVEVGEGTSLVKTRTTVSLVEHLDAESPAGLIERIELVADNVVASTI